MSSWDRAAQQYFDPPDPVFYCDACEEREDPQDPLVETDEGWLCQNCYELHCEDRLGEASE